MKFTSNLKAEPVGIIPARVAQIIFCVLILSASLIASSGEVQGRSIPRKKIGRMAGTSTAMTAQPETEDMHEFDYTVEADVKTLVDDYVEYDGDTCGLISSGSWALASGPKYGFTNTGIA